MTLVDRSETALILAPVGRDAAIAAGMLREARIQSLICPDLDSLVRELSRVSFAVVTEEAVLGRDLRRLSAWIHGQPEWSDLPFVLLTRKGGGLERNPEAKRLLEALGNVTFLERPFHPTTLVSLARAALRARRANMTRVPASKHSRRVRSGCEMRMRRSRRVSRNAPATTSLPLPSFTRRRSLRRSDS